MPISVQPSQDAGALRLEDAVGIASAGHGDVVPGET
jgi:hypothetical protein